MTMEFKTRAQAAKIFKDKKSAIQFVGGLSNPSKMPGYSIGLPAKECNTGSKLREIDGSVCSKCYAHKGCYSWKPTQKAQYRRLERLNNSSHTDWINAMVKALEGQTHFRWHDSGDIQSFEHLWRIVQVARKTPTVKHWLPTKEAKIVRQFVLAEVIPENLVIRVSSPMIDQRPLKTGNTGVLTSTVHTKQGYGYECPAYQQNGKCNDCRACWDNAVPNVSYPQH